MDDDVLTLAAPNHQLVGSCHDDRAAHVAAVSQPDLHEPLEG
jgi:hypothetical protein